MGTVGSPRGNHWDFSTEKVGGTLIPYLGEYRYTVDNAGRLNVPAKFREILKQGEASSDLVLIRGLDSCIYLLPLSTWAKFREPLDDPVFHAERQARWFSRDLLAGGSVQQPDSQGRIQIPKALRDHAGIEDQAVIFGHDNKIEVWAPERFDAYRQAGATMGGTLEEGAAKYLLVRTQRQQSEGGPHDA
ncbi:MAG: cell division/cell wall cluster transcriptional repressor MraZ [Candidatus Eisenbacteria bacterium]|nr:cell division/cell wall cluster transcriptional repressor MraZ [Candidatus Latescibacterota bacterium]MBD3303075.1 cell division/cell wall cluster transcriptional repressor MraZ [Candidatus Eisenbacteria bacterium]